jgi:hypothetical protein
MADFGVEPSGHLIKNGTKIVTRSLNLSKYFVGNSLPIFLGSQKPFSNSVQTPVQEHYRDAPSSGGLLKILSQVLVIDYVEYPSLN